MPLEHFSFTQVILINPHISHLLSEKMKFDTCTFSKEKSFKKSFLKEPIPDSAGFVHIISPHCHFSLLIIPPISLHGNSLSPHSTPEAN